MDWTNAQVIPTALEDDLIFKGSWYGAWGWWGGHAPKERLIPSVIIYDRWHKAKGLRPVAPGQSRLALLAP
jgi:hypothetical protein